MLSEQKQFFRICPIKLNRAVPHPYYLEILNINYNIKYFDTKYINLRIETPL
jgi:hypothetical protein